MHIYQGCDGIKFIVSNKEATVNKCFNIADINATVRNDFGDYLRLYNDGEADDTGLAFLAQEYFAGTSVSFDSSKPSYSFFQFDDWKIQGLADYAVWSNEEGLSEHIKHMIAHGTPSIEPPKYPLVVSVAT